MTTKTTKILHKRGPGANMPALDASEIALATDTNRLYFGTSTHNIELAKNMYGVCDTAASTSAKTMSIGGFSPFPGAEVKVKFTNANTADVPTLNVDATGAHPIVKPDGTAFKNIKAGVYTFVYDGANFTLQGEGGDPREEQSAPEKPVASDITANSVTITAASGAKIRHNNAEYPSPQTFTNLTPGSSYTFYAFYPGSETHIMSIDSPALVVKLPSSIESLVPGGSTVVSTAKSGDSSGSTVNYYGKATGITTGTSLSTLTGITSGTLTTSGDITWLKFKHKGRVLLVADRAIRTGISWDNIQAQNCVTGKRIAINGIDYLCRLMTGSDHYNYNTANGGNTTSIDGGGNEWDDLIVGLTPDNTVSNWNGIYTWCQEVHSNGLTYRVLRGKISAANLSYNSSDNASSDFCWRPVLEVL